MKKNNCEHSFMPSKHGLYCTHCGDIISTMSDKKGLWPQATGFEKFVLVIASINAVTFVLGFAFMLFSLMFAY